MCRNWTMEGRRGPGGRMPDPALSSSWYAAAVGIALRLPDTGQAPERHRPRGDDADLAAEVAQLGERRHRVLPVTRVLRVRLGDHPGGDVVGAHHVRRRAEHRLRHLAENDRRLEREARPANGPEA